MSVAPRGAALIGLALAAWIALVALTTWQADLPVANWVRAHSASPDAHPGILQGAWKTAGEIVRLPGHFYFTAAVALLLGWKHATRWRGALLLCVAGALSGIVVWSMKWLVGRQRPRLGLSALYDLEPFRGGIERLFTQKNLSFPSGDVCLAFATAACLARWFPRWAPGMYAWAMLVAAQRVLSQSHWVSDTLAAAGIGVLCVPLAGRVLRRWGGRWYIKANHG